MPFILAPVGGLQGITPDGAAAQVRGACAFGILPVVSSVSQPSLEESAAAAADDKWFQLYVRGDLEWVHAILGQSAREAGFARWCSRSTPPFTAIASGRSCTGSYRKGGATSAVRSFKAALD